MSTLNRIIELAKELTESNIRALLGYLAVDRELGPENQYRIVVEIICALCQDSRGVRALTDRILEISEATVGYSQVARILTPDLSQKIHRPELLIEALWATSRVGRLYFYEQWESWERELLVDDETRDEARRSFDKLLDKAHNSEPLRRELNRAMERQRERLRHPDEPSDEDQALAAVIYELALSGSPPIPMRLIRALEQLVAEEHTEEKYQVLLAENPVLLDPIASEVLTKKRLGSDLVTDFVVRRHDYEYLVVEIEKPQDVIFTKKNDFSAHFSHALGQILDFQAWIADNAEYARSLMPGISSPRGLLIMGRSPHPDSRQARKLRQFRSNSRAIEVRTYDEVIERARNLYRSIYGHHAE